MFQARLFRGVSWKPRGSHRRGVRVATLRECWTSTPIAAHYLCISPSRFGERTAGSYSTHPVLKATFRALGALPCHLDPETQSSALPPLPPLGYDMRGVSCGKRLRRSWGQPYTCSRVHLLSPGPCLGPRQMLDRVGETASSLGRRVPRAPLNLPSTKKLKYFNIFFSWCQSLYPGCWGCTVLHIYI